LIIVETITEHILSAGRANLEIFSEVLQELAKNDSGIVVVTSDSRGSGKLAPFGKQYPKQHIEVGIAEQNLVGVAAGLASTGKKVFAVSPACFLTARALEQIKNDVAYSDNAVNVIGISAGVSYGALGTTHHSLHDIAALRAIHNILVVAPADNYETQAAIRLAAEWPHPVYLRFGKKNMPDLPVVHEGSSVQAAPSVPSVQAASPVQAGPQTAPFAFGKGRRIRNGNDLTIIGTGETVYPALQAAEKLWREQGLDASVISMHTIKPLDYHLLAEVAAGDKAIITVEEHSIFGGLGEACASFLLEHGYHNPFKIMGIPDEYTVTGSQTEIFDHYGLSEKGISEAALKLVRK
jgi:transketolase